MSVLAGAALVGESVRASLRDLFLNRLGATDSVIAGAGFFREALASSFPGSCPLIAMEGLVIHDRGRAGHVAVYGVDDRFWKFHRRGGKAPEGRDILLSPALAREIGAEAGDSIVVRMQKPSAIPAEWLHGRKDDAGRAMRFTVRQALAPDEDLGEFSLRAQQGAVRAVFVPLGGLQRDLELAGKANTILLAGAADEQALRRAFTLADVGLKLRGASVESDAALISDPLATTAQSVAAAMGMTATPVFTYLANTIRVGDREIPYSLVAAMGPIKPEASRVNEWAARDLGAKVGDTVTLEYYVWKDEGRLATESATFPLTAIVPTRDERDLAPEYPGMTDAESLQDWDPPFPVDLRRVRPRDEEYWKQYRTTPKAFIPLEAGQRLWGSRFGKITSIRLTPPPADFEQRLRDAIDPLQAGLAIIPVRAQGLAAAQGSTDFGEYFTYFSFFLVISALVLTGLFFRLGIEQRLREIGTLRALGFSSERIGGLFLMEGVILAGAGSLIGAGGAAGYGALVVLGLRTLWVDAVGTRLLSLHVSAESLLLGAAGGMLTALISIALSVRKLRSLSPLRLLSGGGDLVRGEKRGYRLAAAILAGLGGQPALLAAAATKEDRSDRRILRRGRAAARLVPAISMDLAFSRRRRRAAQRRPPGIPQRGVSARPQHPLHRAGRPGDFPGGGGRRIPAAGADILRRSEGGRWRLSAAGGVDSAALLRFELRGPDSESGLGKLAASARFRLRPGDDVSCLNLYQPRNPRILAPTPDFLRADRFTFQGGGENPWLRLEAQPVDGAIPAVVDANTLEYTLHLKVGDVFTAGPVKLRIVGALRDSIFQSEFLISEQNFVRLFPEQEGYRFFLIDTADPAKTSELLEQSLSDYGFDVDADGRPAGGLPSRGEYVPVDISDAGLAGTDPGDGGPGRGDAAEYPGAEARAGAAPSDGLPAGGPGCDGAVGKPVSAALGAGRSARSARCWRSLRRSRRAAAASRRGRWRCCWAACWRRDLLASLVAMRAVTRAPLLAALRAE